jgi:hypothetical protein
VVIRNWELVICYWERDARQILDDLILICQSEFLVSIRDKILDSRFTTHYAN